jgi:hypothetical protein
MRWRWPRSPTRRCGRPILIGHSFGGLFVQLLLARVRLLGGLGHIPDTLEPDDRGKTFLEQLLDCAGRNAPDCIVTCVAIALSPERR